MDSLCFLVILERMKLHLLRHAKTNQQSPTGRDFDRELLPKGRAQCHILDRYFEENVQVDDVWCSSAKRTRQTLELIQVKNSFANVSFHDDLYLCSTQTFLQKLWKRPGNDDLLIIGHNFGISDLAVYFTGEDMELRTGGYVCIEFDGLNWTETSRDTGTITASIRPKVNL